MPQEMSFAQALNEARQIIVQQSGRIKSDLDRAKAMKETIDQQAAALAEHERQLKAKTSELEASAESLKQMTAKFDEMKQAKENAEKVMDGQGHRLIQMQDTIAHLEKQAAEHATRHAQVTTELDGLRGQMPTQEDADALAALAQLLAAKKGGSVKAAPTEEAAAA